MNSLILFFLKLQLIKIRYSFEKIKEIIIPKSIIKMNDVIR